MDNYVIDHLKSLYGMDPNVPHAALQFPRMPPSIKPQLFKGHDPVMERFARQTKTASRILYDFQQAYQRHASGLLAMNSQIIPPGHPLHIDESIEALKAENDKMARENAELRKKLEKMSKS